MLLETLKKVKEIWEKEGINLANPLPRFELIETFEKLRTRLSKDVLEVYSNVGGIDDWRSDSICFSFWTIGRVLDENKPDSQLTFFADFLIDSHFYCFKFEDEDSSSIHIYHGEKDIEKVANSFNEFFEIYLNEPGKLLLFDRE